MKPALTIRFACGLLLTLLAVTAFADSLTYDPVGNVATRTTSFGTTTYTYDAVNRLTAETGPVGNFSFSYDANGSRLSDSGGSYTYSATSNRLTARHGHAVTTDAAGNITADGLGHTYVYNQRGYLSEARLNGVLLANYYYDYRGLRTRKVTTAAAPQGAQVVRFVYDEVGHLIEELGTTGAPIRTYVWRDDTPIAQIDHVPTRHIRYFATDHLNTPRTAMDETGKVIWRWESDAFGSTPANEDPDGDGVKTMVNLRFPGQYYDQETGLHYNWYRYYHPGMGQYIQSDPIGLRGGSFSTFAYVGGNPLRYVDPLGLDQTMCFFPNAANGFGHEGLGPTADSTQGFYPDPSSTGLDRLSGPGAVLPDAAVEKGEEKVCTVIKTTADQDKKIADFIAQRKANPGRYNFLSRNCSTFVSDALRAAGVPTTRTGIPGVGRPH